MSGPASGGASPSGSAQTKDFFISYTGTNVDWAAWIAHELEAAGYTTVYQHRDFGAGGVFILQMHEAMRTTKHTIAVLSPEYLLSGYTQAEWAEAVRRDPTGKHRLLLPVRVRDCKPDGMFGARVYCDLVGLNETGARERLLVAAKEVAVELPPPVSAPEVSLPPVQLQPITPAQHAVLTKKPSEPHRENVFGFFGVLPVGTLVNDRFRVKKLLGQGVQSNVYLVEDEARLFGNRFALKESLSSTVSERRQFNREVKWLLGLDHPNLPAVIAQFEWN
ncbi:MAG TPA: TIR domain-containing protein, partial [Ktedonobacterales bacterium]